MKNIKLSILMITLLLVQKTNFSQLINLGTAANFVLFTSTGALATTGISNFTGNVGSHIGAISGFGTSVLTGVIENANVVTNQAKIDLLVAHNNLISIPATVSSHAAIFGGGEILTPGVYTIASAGSLNGNITLNGLGDTTSVFIFRFGGAYTVNALSEIILTNGVRACNIFWVSEGAISIGTLSILKGTFIANNSAISMAANTDLIGRFLSTTGAISVDASTANIADICVQSIIILSIELLTFKSECINQNVELTWSTASEINNNYYSLERSLDGVNWQIIAKINGADNSNSINSYSFTDTISFDVTLYYRLKQTDFDEKYKYSHIISVEKCKHDGLEFYIFPNPSNKIINLSFNGATKNIKSISIYNVFGEIVYLTEELKSKIILENKSNGIYFIHINLISKTIIKKLIIVN